MYNTGMWGCESRVGISYDFVNQRFYKCDFNFGICQAFDFHGCNIVFFFDEFMR